MVVAIVLAKEDKMKVLPIGSLIMFLVASGCVVRGQNFPSDTAWIEVDQTRQQHVRTRMGDPFSVGRTNTGPSWTYGYYRHTLLGNSFTKELILRWNEDGTVRSYSFTSSFPEDKARAVHAK